MARTAFLSIIIIKWVFLPSTSMSLSLILKSNVRATDVQFLSKNRRYLWHFFSFSLSQIIHRWKKLEKRPEMSYQRQKLNFYDDEKGGWIPGMGDNKPRPRKLFQLYWKLLDLWSLHNSQGLWKVPFIC